MTARSLSGDAEPYEATGYEAGEDDYDHYDEDAHASSLAATILWLLLGAICVAVLTLWAAPRLAPHMPEPVARFLAPMPAALTARVSELEAELAAQVSAQTAAIAGLSQTIEAMRQSPGLSAAAADRLAALEAGQGKISAAQNAATATAEAARAEARVASAEAERNRRIARAADQGAKAAALDAASALEVSGDAREAAQAAEAQAVQVAAAIAALDDQIARQIEALGPRIEAAEARAESSRSSAFDEAEAALRNATLRASADALVTRVLAGESYASKLAEVVSLTGRAAPEALVAHAANGLTSPAVLSAKLPKAARAGIAAMSRAQGDGSAGGRVSSWLQSQVFVMPTEERSGSGLEDRISRIKARMSDGELQAALTEAEALPPAAAAAMADWTRMLRARVSAEAALAAYIAPALAGE